MCIQRKSTWASLLWPFHSGPVQNTDDAAALKLLVHYIHKYGRLSTEGISLAAIGNAERVLDLYNCFLITRELYQ